MKLALFFVISCLASINGAPTRAKYKHVRCNPDGNNANCVVYESTEMPWTPDLPTKLPASAAENLKTTPVEDESPLWEEDNEEDEETEQVEEDEEDKGVEEDEEDEGVQEDEEDERDEEDDELQMTSEDRGLPLLYEEGSGIEGSGISDYSIMPDLASMAETGSGESDTDPFRGEQADRRLSRYPLDEAKPAEHEMKEDHLLEP